MPNEICFLLAYVGAFILEAARFASSNERVRVWNTWAAVAMMILALVTHTLFFADRIWNASPEIPFGTFRTWHGWGLLAAWLIASAAFWMSWRRSDKQIGLFVLPLVIAIIGLAIAVPSSSPIVTSSSTSFWRFSHSTAMLIGTMLIAVGFAVAMMYFVQGWRLKHLGSSTNSLRLPSLEYLQSIGRKCILGSAIAVGFGVITGAIMNLTQHGKIAWTDRGILFSAVLFLWLCTAAMLQWIFSSRGRGEWTAFLNLLSFAVVVIALAVVMSAPHGNTPSSILIPLAPRWQT